MILPNRAPDTRSAWDLHVESHRHMHEENPKSFAELSLPEQLGSGSMLDCITLPDKMDRAQEELTIFRSELDIMGLTEDR